MGEMIYVHLVGSNDDVAKKRMPGMCSAKGGEIILDAVKVLQSDACFFEHERVHIHCSSTHAEAERPAAAGTGHMLVSHSFIAVVIPRPHTQIIPLPEGLNLLWVQYGYAL